MFHAGDEVAHHLADIFEGPSGLLAKLTANQPEAQGNGALRREATILRGQAPLALLGKHTTCKFPICAVYCRKLTNSMREKFSGISGTAEIVVEATVSDTALENTAENISAIVLSITEVLREHRGEWSVGGYFGGAWEVQVEPAKTGGAQYIQTARVVLTVDVRRN